MYELTTLENGLRVLTVTMSHVQSASLGFFVGVGSRYEADELAGASHFIEHMLFKGTARWPSALEIAEAIEGKGGIFNASTGLEATLYWAKVAAHHLPEALDVLSDMLLHAKFAPEEIEKERAVIHEEISYTLDAPEGIVQLAVNRLQWPDHPLGRDVAGSQHSVSALSRPALLAYLSNHYRPSKTVLGIAGGVDHKEVVDWARRHLGGWEPGPSFSFAPAPENNSGPNVHVEYKDTEQAHICLSFEGMSRGDPGRHALRLLNVMLGEGMRSRLFQKVRERLGLAYSVDSFVSTLLDTGAVGIYAGVAAGRVEQAIQAILDELEQMKQEPVSEEELQKALDFVRGRLTLSLEDSFTMAAWFARQELLGPDVLYPDQVMAHFDAVQPADIQRTAQMVFQPERLNVAIVGPFPETPTEPVSLRTLGA
jgi:predicted Zn-dependent peptidase